MRSPLPLYLPGKSLAEGGHRTPVEDAQPLALDKGCTLCKLAEGVRSPCLPPDGDAGGLLVVGASPTAEDDSRGVVFSSGANYLLRGTISKYWTGPVAYDYALRCAPGKRPVTPKQVGACRGYLAATVQEVKPTRLIVLGGSAAQAILGRNANATSAPRAVAWLSDDTPVFILPSPLQVVRNRFERAQFENDLIHALTCDITDTAFPRCTGVYQLIETEQDALDAERALATHGAFAYDCEWVGRPYSRDFVVTNIACCPVGEDAAWVWDSHGLLDPARVAPLKRLMLNSRVRKVGANLSVDVHAVERYLKVPVVGQDSDVRLKRKLLDATADADLATMAEIVGMGGHKAEASAWVDVTAKTMRKALKLRAKEATPTPAALDRLFPWVPLRVEEVSMQRAAVEMGFDTGEESGRKGEERSYTLGVLPADVAARYNARDAVATARVEAWVQPLLAAEPDLERTWLKIVRPAMRAVQRVESWGIAVDRDALRHLQTHLQSRIDEVALRLEAAEPGMNWSSPKQLAELFYGKLKLPIQRLTDSNNPSTDEAALEGLRGRHPAIDDLLEFRSLNKMKGTYADGLLRVVDEDGRIHGYLLLDGAGTGRTSMKNPNLQNVPRADTPDGKLIRACVIAAPGHLLVEFDFSTLEPRIAAVLSKDAALRGVFLRGEDFHKATARIIQPILWPKAPVGPDGLVVITKDQRQESKPVGLAALYGKHAGSMAETLGVSKAKAQAVLDAILVKYADLKQWIDGRMAYTRKHGESWTWWDGHRARRRPLTEIASPEEGIRGNAERGSYNGPIQGTASDFLIASLTEVVDLISTGELPGKLLLPIHDSLLLEVPTESVSEVIVKVKQVMTSWPSDGVPLLADCKIGVNWSSMLDEKDWLAHLPERRKPQ